MSCTKEWVLKTCKDNSKSLVDRLLEIRGITNERIYNNNAEYQNRPQEIFAEDFRLLYGGEDARAGEHLNSDLYNPTDSEELKAFFEKVIGE